MSLQNLAIAFFKPFAGKKQFHSAFFALFKIGMHGMNFNKGGDVYSSGEALTLNYAKRRIGREDIIAFDVGANVGNYADLLLKELGQEGAIYSLEPMSDTFEVLKKRFAEASNVKTFKLGFSDTAGTAPIFSNHDTSTFASLHDRQLDHIGVEMQEYDEVNLETIDAFCREEKIDRIDFLKIDVEGHELAALKGAKNMLESGNIKFIQFEMGPTSIDSRVFFRDFWNLLNEQYSLYRILQNGLFPIDQYNEDYEIFKNMNYLAELKS